MSDAGGTDGATWAGLRDRYAMLLALLAETDPDPDAVEAQGAALDALAPRLRPPADDAERAAADEALRLADAARVHAEAHRDACVRLLADRRGLDAHRAYAGNRDARFLDQRG